MKQKVIAFLHDTDLPKQEQFEKAVELYRQSPNKNGAFERKLNSGGFSEQMLGNLRYDLQKMHNISDVEILLFEAKELEEIEVEGVIQLTPQTEGLEGLGKEEGEPETGEEEIELVNQTVSIREEFPFLNDKDCPNELKILVSDKITAWKRYQALHAIILNIEAGTVEGTDEEKANLAKDALEAFDENQLIYEELNAYKETGKVLGKHSIFRTLALFREVDAMNNEELINYINSSKKFFSVNKKEIKTLSEAKELTEKEQTRLQDLSLKVQERQETLDLVKKKLGVSAK